MAPQPMRIRFRCGKCATAIKAPENAAGKTGTCPKCGQKLIIPHQSRITDESLFVHSTAGTSDPRQATLAMTIAGFKFEDDAADSNLGRTLGGEFVVESLLGVGGIARVYKAQQKSTGRNVAVKVLSGQSLTQSRLARFKREALTVARLSHPNILQIHGFGYEDGVCWMAMEYAPGGDLLSRVRLGPPPWELGYRWLRQTLAGLQAAHDAGVVHRDLKPQNLMLAADESIRIADFGLVKVADDSGQLTGEGKTVGTPAYISPEQALGEDVDSRADIYSLGATYYHIFAGRAPFIASSSTAILLKHVQETPPPLEETAPNVPLPLCWIIMRMMEKNRERRYQTATVALADLESYTKFGALQPRASDDSTKTRTVAAPGGSTGGTPPYTGGPRSDDNRTCPYCGEPVKSTAARCRYCGANLSAPAGHDR